MPRVQLTIGTMMVAVAIIAVGLALAAEVPVLVWLATVALLLPVFASASSVFWGAKRAHRLVPPTRVAIRLLLTVIAIAIVAWTVRLGLSHVGQPPKGAPVVELAPPPDHRGQDPGSNSDHEILDVVLSDLIKSREFYPGKAGTQIVPDETTSPVPWVSTMWKLLGEKANTLPPDILANVSRRNPSETRYSLAQYHPSNPGIILCDLSRLDLLGSDFDETYPKARGYIQAALPGYSRDGQTALLLFTYGPDQHSTAGFVLLRKTKKGWEVVWRHLRQVSL